MLVQSQTVVNLLCVVVSSRESVRRHSVELRKYKLFGISLSANHQPPNASELVIECLDASVLHLEGGGIFTFSTFCGNVFLY